jgi:hypothetical protein
VQLHVGWPHRRGCPAPSPAGGGRSGVLLPRVRRARVQRDWEARRRPLHPRPGDQKTLIGIAAVMEPFLRGEGDRSIQRNFAFLFRGKPPDRRHRICGKMAEGEGKKKERAARRRGRTMRDPPLLFYVKRNANRQRSRSQVNNDSVLARSPVSRTATEALGEVGASTTQPAPRASPARRLWGPTALRPCRFGFSWKPSPSAPWARGLLSAFWEPGYPDLPACGPWRGPSGGRVRPIFSTNPQHPREGPSLARRTTPRPPEGAAHES